MRDATDLVELAGRYTELRRAGNDRMGGLCPLHDERTPIVHGLAQPSKQLFKCFGEIVQVCQSQLDALQRQVLDLLGVYLTPTADA